MHPAKARAQNVPRRSPSCLKMSVHKMDYWGSKKKIHRAPEDAKQEAKAVIGFIKGGQRANSTGQIAQGVLHSAKIEVAKVSTDQPTALDVVQFGKPLTEVIFLPMSLCRVQFRIQRTTKVLHLAKCTLYIEARQTICIKFLQAQ